MATRPAHHRRLATLRSHLCGAGDDIVAEVEAEWTFERHTVAQDVSLRVAIAGPRDGPLVVLLHGFPQGWFLWRKIIRPLAAAGFLVAAPDQRGFGASSQPTSVDAYDYRTLAADVVALGRALGRERFYLVGHDLGCMVAWTTAMLCVPPCSALLT